MPNAKDMPIPATKRILLLGRPGSGKSAQMWTLPGRKFLYLFDPNTKATIGKHKDRAGLDIEYEEFLPDITELDASIKGFNKGSKSDKLRGPQREPTTYVRWVEHLNEQGEKGFFNDFDWLCIDGLTHLNRAAMARTLYINGRYGDIEDLSDYRVTGNKLTDVFHSVCSTDRNIYMTGHIDTYQDDKTKTIETLIRSHGSSRGALPTIFTDVWLAERGDGDKYTARTKPASRGLKDIRCSIPNVPEIADITIPDFPSSRGGIGALLAKYNS